jgi:hypothetical protein
MTAVVTAVAVHRVVAGVTRAAALVVAVRVQVLAKRRLRPSSLVLLAQLQIVSALAPAAPQNSQRQARKYRFVDSLTYYLVRSISTHKLGASWRTGLKTKTTHRVTLVASSTIHGMTKTQTK